jgi:hypothetical protein
MAKAKKGKNGKKPVAKPAKPAPAPVETPTVTLPAAAADAMTQAPTLPDIYQKTIALSLDRAKFGNRRKVSMANVEVDADKHMLALSKRLLDSPELKAIATLDNEAQAFLNDVAVPSFFKPGVYLVPLGAVEKVEAKLSAIRDQRTAALDAFIAAYPAAVDAMKTVLRDMYNPGDYPSAEEMRRQFGFSWRYLNLGTPNQLQSINGKLFAEQRKQIEATVQDAAQEIRVMLRGSMQQIIAHMLDRLTPGADGKPKVFRDSLVENFNKFIDNFSLRNITDDAELQTLVTQAKAIVGGVDVKMLRDDAALRQNIVTGIETIKTTLDTMVTTKGRAFLLDDDDEPAFRVQTTGQKAWATRKARQASAAPKTAAADAA